MSTTPLPQVDPEAVDRFASYAGSIADHVDISCESLNELFQACASLWVLAGPGTQATAQWNRAREAFARAIEFMACSAHDLDEASVRGYFGLRLTSVDEARAAELSHAAEE